MKLTSAMLVALASLMFSGACKKKQEGPSLSETVAWMEQTYNPHEGGFGHGQTRHYPPSWTVYTENTETLSADGCALILHFNSTSGTLASGHTLSSTTFTFNLKDVDPKSIAVTPDDSQLGQKCSATEEAKRGGSTCDQADIDFSIRNDAPLVEVETGSPPSRQRKAHDAFLLVNDPEYAQRLASALRHAVELCGGKPSPF
jgi:hypothetical protein